MSGTLRRQFKICLIGDGYVGKTSIRREYLKEGFKKSYIPTLGVDFAQKSIMFEDVPTNLVIWDIAGQPLFQNLRKRYYDGSSGIILVYSVVDRDSFDNASKWLVEAHGFVGKFPALMIIGNKVDLRPSHPRSDTVSSEEGREFTRKFGEELETPTVFIETSAMTGENIDEAFNTLTRLIVYGKVDEEKAEPLLVPVESPEGVIHATEQTASAEPEMTDQTHVVAPSTNESAAAVSADSTVSNNNHLDPVTSLVPDSHYLEEDTIGKSMTELNKMREDLHRLEEELASTTSSFETKLLNLRNLIHVKKIMYEHLRGQLNQTRQEWAEAYDEYVKIDTKKKDEIARFSKEIEETRGRIEKMGRTIRQRVSDLDLKKLSG
ncbi:MAG: GTP-binding protein [Candidatus Thorarchaeota archaeon]